MLEDFIHDSPQLLRGTPTLCPSVHSSLPDITTLQLQSQLSPAPEMYQQLTQKQITLDQRLVRPPKIPTVLQLKTPDKATNFERLKRVESQQKEWRRSLS